MVDLSQNHLKVKIGLSCDVFEDVLMVEALADKAVLRSPLKYNREQLYYSVYL